MNRNVLDEVGIKNENILNIVPSHGGDDAPLDLLLLPGP